MGIFVTLIGIIVAAGAGFYFGRNLSGNEKERVRLESELKEKQVELEAFRGKVNSHFEKTAELFNQVSDSYQSLYDHMANSSTQLCASPTFQALPQASDDAPEAMPHPAHKTNRDKNNLFDADNLYKAHEYRNQAETESDEPEAIESKAKEDDKVVDIETAKDDKKAPPLDYAIKEKGVVNHNSLDVDGVKTS